MKLAKDEAKRSGRDSQNPQQRRGRGHSDDALPYSPESSSHPFYQDMKKKKDVSMQWFLLNLLNNYQLFGLLSAYQRLIIIFIETILI